MELLMQKQEIKDLKKIISIQEKIIKSQKEELSYFKKANNWIWTRAMEDWSKYNKTNLHNVALKTYADNLWKSWKIWKAGEEDVSK